MNRAPVDNGYGDRTLARPRDGAPLDGGPGLGDVAKDAIDHVREIVSDSVAIGKLEAKRVIEKVEETTKDIVPRMAIGAAAGAVGFVGLVLGLIAIFIALGEVIPSTAARLGIFAGVFLVLAAAGGFIAARPLIKKSEPKPVKVTTTTRVTADKPAPLTPTPPSASTTH